MPEQDDPQESDITRSESLDVLTSFQGDIYMEPEIAREAVAGFADDLNEALDDDEAAAQDSGLWVNRYIAEVAKLAMNARGMPTVPQYEPLVPTDELSERIAEDLGIEVGEGMAVGHARAARERHRETVQNIADHFDIDIEE